MREGTRPATLVWKGLFGKQCHLLQGQGIKQSGCEKALVQVGSGWGWEVCWVSDPSKYLADQCSRLTLTVHHLGHQEVASRDSPPHFPSLQLSLPSGTDIYGMDQGLAHPPGPEPSVPCFAHLTLIGPGPIISPRVSGQKRQASGAVLCPSQ